MKIYCTPEFKKEYDNLLAKNSYADLPRVIIEYFFGKPIADLQSGSRIFNIPKAPYIKKRLNGRGGYRIDFQLIEKEDGEVILVFVYPKTGKHGQQDLSTDFRKTLLKSLILSRKEGTLLELSSDDKGEKINFKPSESKVSPKE